MCPSMLCLTGGPHLCVVCKSHGSAKYRLQDLELFQQAVAANLAVHSYFVDLVNRSIPEGTATKAELAQVCKRVDQGSVLHHLGNLLLYCCPA